MHIFHVSICMLNSKFALLKDSTFFLFELYKWEALLIKTSKQARHKWENPFCARTNVTRHSRTFLARKKVSKNRKPLIPIARIKTLTAPNRTPFLQNQLKRKHRHNFQSLFWLAKWEPWIPTPSTWGSLSGFDGSATCRVPKLHEKKKSDFWWADKAN